MIKESLTLIKSLMTEDVYHTSNEKDFMEKYIDATGHDAFTIDEKLMIDCDRFASIYPYMPNPKYSCFYNNIYNSFKFIYEIEKVLDYIQYDGLSLNRAKALMNSCSILTTVSTNAMIYIDDDFSFDKKYSLAKDIYIMSKNIYDELMFVYASSLDDMSRDDIILLTDFDELESRLSCKYIRNGIAALKLFHILAIFQALPIYSDGVHKIAKKLIQSLREVFFNKRIIKLVVDVDTQGLNSKAHKTTRIKIIFSMGNSDRYCIRLDFPHEGEDNIHLNINEPAHKHSSGFPFGENGRIEAFNICQDDAVFNELFYFQDDLYWFRSNYAAVIKRIGKNNKEQGQALEDFLQKMRHLVLLSPDEGNLASVSEFSAALAEAITEYDELSVYGTTDSSDDELYQYALFQDFIFDIIIRIKAKETYNVVLGKHINRSNSEPVDLAMIKSKLCDYIKEKFSQDELLVKYSNDDMAFVDFISKCLDRIDQYVL